MRTPALPAFFLAELGAAQGGAEVNDPQADH
jgi:hypothetical protein